MANTTRWVIDANWTAATFTASELTSQASGGGALSTSVVANGTALDQFIDVSFVVAVGATTVIGGFMTLFLLPLNQDGTTYGDGYASSGTTQPSSTYAIGSPGSKIGVTSGNTITGIVTGVSLPPGDFKLAIGNNLTIALASTAALTLKYRTYNINLNV